MNRLKACKPSFEKENQQKYVNKKTDLLSSLHNIKLPISHHNSSLSNFKSLPLTASISTPNSLMVSARSPKQFSCTQSYCAVYGHEVEEVVRKEEKKGSFLSRHKIDGALRARMLDWMVEVMSSYNFQHKTYFAGVQLMDRFFVATKETLLPTQLHIIGVQSMFIGSKMEEVYPLKIKTVYDKISHKKIPVADLVKMENTIISALDFQLVSSTAFDLAVTRLSKLMCQERNCSHEQLLEMEDLCSCLAKFMYYNYNMICEFSKETLANTLCKCTSEILGVEWEKMSRREMECRVLLGETIVGFRKQFKGLNNLCKFTDKKVMERVEGLFCS